MANYALSVLYSFISPFSTLQAFKDDHGHLHPPQASLSTFGTFFGESLFWRGLVSNVFVDPFLSMDSEKRAGGLDGLLEPKKALTTFSIFFFRHRLSENSYADLSSHDPRISRIGRVLLRVPTCLVPLTLCRNGYKICLQWAFTCGTPERLNQ